jgi:uncharacterized membrane protein
MNAEEQPLAVRWTVLGVLAAGGLALLGLVALWPRGDAPDLGIQPNTYVDATVTAIQDGMCDDPEIAGPGQCLRIGARLTSGDDKGDEVTFQVLATQTNVPPIHEGDRVVLRYVPTSPVEYRYSFSDFQRRQPLMWLVIAFVAVVVAFGRWQGVRALLGLVGSGLILVAFVVPALLRDEPALLVALTGTVAVAFVAVYLAHGLNTASTVALAGTILSLGITAVLALVAAGAASLNGLSDQNAQTLRFTAEALDLRGLLIAGIVVGALGVLDDVTVSQVSTVGALRRANPEMATLDLYREAIRVGRDHVASTVNTLILAYAGASLPLILFFSQGSQPVGRLVTSEVVAVELVRMLVGSIGLVVSVPITTALAAAVLGTGDDTHAGHHHGPLRDDPAPAPVAAGAPSSRRRQPGAGQDPWRDFAPEERRF